ncbi:MAG: hypothetical protein JW791_03580 [Nanoarchaeota archaeon]|nr:hypothetical protein [Nanoarchaeota archaeon]
MNKHNRLCFDDLFVCEGASLLVGHGFFKLIKEEYGHFERLMKDFSDEELENYEIANKERAESVKKTLSQYLSGIEVVSFQGSSQNVLIQLLINVYPGTYGTAYLVLGNPPEVHITQPRIYKP